MPGIFYQLIRIYITNSDGKDHHSTQFYHAEDYDSIDAMLKAATGRWHNVLAADLQNADIGYCAAYIIDNGGTMLNKAVYDNRPAPEPEPEPEPAPELDPEEETAQLSETTETTETTES